MKCTHDLRFAVLAALPLPCVTTRVHDDPAVTVIDFTNASSASWFHGNLGSQLAEVPGDEPSSAGDFNAAERQKRNAVLAEPGFARSGRVRQGSGNVAGTKYPITGSVGSHTEDISRTGGGRSKAYDVIDLRGHQCGDLEGRSLGPPGLCDGQAPELHGRLRHQRSASSAGRQGFAGSRMSRPAPDASESGEFMNGGPAARMEDET